jgi:hypothetical protein
VTGTGREKTDALDLDSTILIGVIRIRGKALSSRFDKHGGAIQRNERPRCVEKG